MSLNCYFNLVFLKRVYMTSFSYHKNAKKKIPNIIFGATFHFSWQDDLSFLSGRGAGRVLCPEVQPLTLLYSIFTEKLPFSYTFHWQMVPLSHA